MKNDLEKEFENLKKENKNFVFLDGEQNILISTPHSVEQTRDEKIKYSEPETALIALYLNKLGFPCIIKTSNENDDANYDLDSKYKEEILTYCNNKKIDFVIDLHELSPKREMNFCLGFGDENYRNLTNKKYLVNLIKNTIEKHNFNYKINEPFSASSIRTVSGFLSSKGISAMQLEINSNIISDFCGGKQFDEIVCMVKDLVFEIKGAIENNENINSK